MAAAKVSQARAVRLVRREARSFQTVVDPRDQRFVVHPLAGLMCLQVAAFAAGKRTLRQMEYFGEDQALPVLREFGLGAPPSDTAMYEIDAAVDPTGLAGVLEEQLKVAFRQKAITDDLFPGGVLSIDGKGAGSGLGEAPTPLARESVFDENGSKCWDLFTQRAVLTSSSARPCLGQAIIDRKSAEPTTFPKLLAYVDDRYGAHYRYVTSDAGNISATNAQEVLSDGKLYVFGLKANFNRLFPLAQGLLNDAPVEAQTIEWRNGAEERRELRRARVPAEEPFPGAKQFWGVRRTWTEEGERKVEDRIFITAIPWDELSADQALLLVRLHWGIENGSNWPMDVVFEEDTHSPCKTGNGIATTCWLRLLAYNIVAIFRAHLPKRDRRAASWERVRELVYQAFLGFRSQWAFPSLLNGSPSPEKN